MKSFKSLIIRTYIKIKEKTAIIDDIKIKYVYKKGKTKNLIVVFSGFAGKYVPGKYNLVRTLLKNNDNQLFILDDFGFQNVGSYYLGNNMNLWKNDSIMKLINKFSKKYKIEKSIFCGSSKGGSSALLYGLKMDVDYIIAGSPQYDVLKYLSKNQYHEKILESIICGKQSNRDLIEDIIKKEIYNSNKKTKIMLLISSLEDSYESDICNLLKDLEINNINSYIQDGKFISHDEIGKFFPNFLLNCMKMIKTEVNK